jgi:anti-anti-sigma regulatory factor
MRQSEAHSPTVYALTNVTAGIWAFGPQGADGPRISPLIAPPTHLAAFVPITQAAMLKITLHDSANELRFRLEGRLCGAWVGELRQCWLTAQSTAHNRKTTVDLSEVDYVDAEGQSVLAEMFRYGAALKAVTPLIRGMVQEIERSGRYATVEGAPGQRSDVLDSAHSVAPHRGAL